MWNERYAVDEYFYGTEPNVLLAEHSGMLSGPVLSLAERGGRNGVFLASLGLQVHGVDGSDVGLTKAQALARSKGVEIETEIADLGMFEPEENHYRSVIPILPTCPV